MPADLEVERDDGVRGGEGTVDIAVALAQDGRLGRQAGRETARRRGRVEQRRQLFRFDRHEIGRILR